MQTSVWVYMDTFFRQKHLELIRVQAYDSWTFQNYGPLTTILTICELIFGFSHRRMSSWSLHDTISSWLCHDFWLNSVCRLGRLSVKGSLDCQQTYLLSWASGPQKTNFSAGHSAWRLPCYLEVPCNMQPRSFHHASICQVASALPFGRPVTHYICCLPLSFAHGEL